MGSGCSQTPHPAAPAKLDPQGAMKPTEDPVSLGDVQAMSPECVQDFVAECSSTDETPRLKPTCRPESEKAASPRSPSFHADLENRWFDGSSHDERRSTPSPSPTEPANLQTYVEMSTPQRHTPSKQKAASAAVDKFPAGSPGQANQRRGQFAWGFGKEDRDKRALETAIDSIIQELPCGFADEVRPLTPMAVAGDRDGTPVPFRWEGNDNAAMSLVDADISLSPIAMDCSLQAVDPSFVSFESSKLEQFDLKLEQSTHSEFAETPGAFAPISIRSAVPDFAVPAFAPPSPPKVVSLGALKRSL
jgi:hypothetical protein